VTNEELNLVPLFGIYILDNSGVPLFARYYQEDDPEGLDTTLMAGFFSAIEIFVKTSLKGKLTDIGLNQRRIFFDRTPSGFIFVAFTKSERDLYIDEKQQKIIEICLHRLGYLFDLLKDASDRHFVRLNSLVRGLGDAIDSLLFESSLEFLDEELISSDYYSGIKTGVDIDAKILDDVVEKITLDVKL